MLDDVDSYVLLASPLLSCFIEVKTVSLASSDIAFCALFLQAHHILGCKARQSDKGLFRFHSSSWRDFFSFFWRPREEREIEILLPLMLLLGTFCLPIRASRKTIASFVIATKGLRLADKNARKLFSITVNDSRWIWVASEIIPSEDVLRKLISTISPSPFEMKIAPKRVQATRRKSTEKNAKNFILNFINFAFRASKSARRRSFELKEGENSSETLASRAKPAQVEFLFIPRRFASAMKVHLIPLQFAY